jgi:hypothetical protein
LTALALYGLLFVVARRPRHYGWLIGWFVLTWVSMFLHIPLREKHLPIFLPMLALLAGFGLHHLFDFVRTQFGRPLALNTASILLTGLAALGMLIWHVPQAVALNNGEPGAQVVNEDYNHILPALDQVSSPDDCVIADNPLFLHYARRLPPPELAEASQTRIETGYLTLNDITSAATNYRCHVVAVVTPRFGEYVSGVRAWLSENYIGFYERNDIELYFARIGADLNFEPLPETTFDGRIKLYGLRLNDQPWSAGESHYLSLYWQNEAGPINGDFEIITLQAADGSEVYRFAWPMLGRLFDPAAWPLGQAAKDVIRLDLPADLPAGDYTVTLSLCAAETGPCYSFSPTAGTDETRLSLGQITIKP